MGVLGNLSSDQLHLFNSQGYLVIESFASPEEMESMKKRMDEMIDEFDPATISEIFSSKTNQQATTDYSFESVEKASFFFEEKAFDDDGNLKQPKHLSLSKVAHALHEIDPTFKRYSRSEKVSTLLSSLGYKRPVIIQSVYIFKQPSIGSEVAPHQDSTFLYTEPISSTGLWLALEDATITNGCMWAIPGSHKKGLARRFIRDEEGVRFDKPSPSYNKSDFVPIEVKAGSLVLIHGLLVHQSYPNQSSKSRHAYSMHALDTEGCIWPQENWIRRKVDLEPLYT